MASPPFFPLHFAPALTEVPAQSACPPREVRSFRVLLLRDDDARATRRPARRVVELTVWDVLSLAFDGVPAGQFKEGQIFQVSISLMCLIEFDPYWEFFTFGAMLFSGHELIPDAEKCVDGP